MYARFDAVGSFSDRASFFSALRWACRSARVASAVTCTTIFSQTAKQGSGIKGLLFFPQFSLAALSSVVQSQPAKDGKLEPRPSSVIYKDNVQQKGLPIRRGLAPV